MRLTAGLGRPLILTTLERDEAMRVLAGGARRAPLVAALALGGGLVLLSIGLALGPARGLDRHGPRRVAVASTAPGGRPAQQRPGPGPRR